MCMCIVSVNTSEMREIKSKKKNVKFFDSSFVNSKCVKLNEKMKKPMQNVKHVK